MQMKRKLCGLFRTTPEISKTDLQQSSIVHFAESGKHAKRALRSVPQVERFNEQFYFTILLYFKYK